MVSRRMISMCPYLFGRLFARERQQRNVACLLDRVVQLSLVGRAHTRDSSRHDLCSLRNELRKQLHVFVVDRIDAFDAELADFLAPVILLLLRHSSLSLLNSTARLRGSAPAIPRLPLARSTPVARRVSVGSSSFVRRGEFRHRGGR